MQRQSAIVLRPGLGISPILSDDVVAALADVALGAPVNGTLEVAGSDKIHLDELVRRFLSASKDTRQVITGVHARFYGSELDDYSLIPGDNARIAPAHCFGSSPVLLLTALPNDLVAHPVRFFRSKKAHYRGRGEKAPVIHAGDESPPPPPREREDRKKPAI